MLRSYHISNLPELRTAHPTRLSAGSVAVSALRAPHHLCRLNDMATALDACRAVSNFTPTLTGGDGDGTQFCKHRVHPVTPPQLPLESDRRS